MVRSAPSTASNCFCAWAHSFTASRKRAAPASVSRNVLLRRSRRPLSTAIRPSRSSGRIPAILSYILSVPVFILILFLTRLLAGGLERTGVSTPRPLLLLQLFFLIACLAVCVVASPRRDADAVLAVTAGMFGVAAMAVQNALVQISLTNTPTTAVMTTNITHFMLGLGEVLVGRDRARLAHARARAMHTFW